MMIYTKHALKRQQQRGISSEIIELVLTFGRQIYTRGALIYALGRKEINAFSENFPELKGLNGLQVVTASDTGVIITCYRNRSFKGLR